MYSPGLELEDEVEYMDTSDTQWNWFYKAGCGVWHRVEDQPVSFMSSADLERYYTRNPYGVVNMTTAGGPFLIDFARRMQCDLKTGQTMQIKRSFRTENSFRCKCDDVSPSLPAHWENADPKHPYRAFTVRRDSSEYQKIESFVKNVGLLQETIVSICRIQNMDLWELFCRYEFRCNPLGLYSGASRPDKGIKFECEKLSFCALSFIQSGLSVHLEEFAEKPLFSGVCQQTEMARIKWIGKKIQLMRIKGQTEIKEQMLFHGTSFKNLDSICTFNFNCRLPDWKRCAHICGKGTYFAKYASYASRYSGVTNVGTKIMLLARVIVGKYKKGRMDYCTPNDDENEYKHDSCVDNTLYPHIFVVFDSNQIYPEYVLEYR